MRKITIPANQAGFKYGRRTTDHLVKLTSHIKKTVFEGNSTMATFFNVKKAVCGTPDYFIKWKTGITDVMFQCFKNFLSKRGICTGEGKTYSSNKQIDYGYSTGLSYCTYLIKQYYTWSPKSIIKNTHVAQYADDIAINFGLKQLLESTRIRGW